MSTHDDPTIAKKKRKYCESTSNKKSKPKGYDSMKTAKKPILLSGSLYQTTSSSCTSFSSLLNTTSTGKMNLTNALFGSNDQKKKLALQFDSSSTSSSFLFDNEKRDKYNSAVLKRKTKNSITLTNASRDNPIRRYNLGVKNGFCDNVNHDSFMNVDRKKILALRKRRSNNLKILKVSKSINLDLSTLFLSDDSNSNSLNKNAKKMMIREDIQGASIEVSQTVRKMGVATITSPSSIDSCVTLFPSSLIDELSSKAKQIQQEICTRLTEKKIEFTNSKSIFRFHEVASRCKGRLDVRHGTSSSPFSNPSVISNHILLPIVHHLLGQDSELVYVGLIYSFPNSSDQPWHMDGTTLFPELTQNLGKRNKTDEENFGKVISPSSFQCFDLPPYALNIFIPLARDITEEIGPTEFFPQSHLSDTAHKIDDDLKKLRSWNITNDSKNISRNYEEDDHDDRKKEGNSHSDQICDKILTQEEKILNDHNVIAPLLKKGDALIYDYRVCHRGTANLSDTNITSRRSLDRDEKEDKTRIMLYLMYARPWFKEHINFGNDRLFSE